MTDPHTLPARGSGITRLAAATAALSCLLTAAVAVLPSAAGAASAAPAVRVTAAAAERPDVAEHPGHPICGHCWNPGLSVPLGS